MPLAGFTELLQHNCKNSRGRIALPESEDVRILQAAHELVGRQAVQEIFLFLSKETFTQLLPQAGLGAWQDFERLVFVADEVDGIAEKTFQHINKILAVKHKKYGDELLWTMARDPLYQAGYLVAVGRVDAAVAGAVHTTAQVIKAGLATIACAAGIKTVSGAFFMVREGKAATTAEDQLFLFADCGVVIDPQAEQLVDIAAASVETWQKIVGPAKAPVVAFLSFSTRGSATHPLVDKVRTSTALFRSRYPQVLCDGELQFDAAFDAEVGKRKAADSPVPGLANIFIFPSLEAGNIAYKIAQRLGGFEAYGPILQGLARPYSDLSRGANVHDIIMSVYINLLRGQVN